MAVTQSRQPGSSQGRASRRRRESKQSCRVGAGMHEKGKKHRKPDRRIKKTVFQAPKGRQERKPRWQWKACRRAGQGRQAGRRHEREMQA